MTKNLPEVLYPLFWVDEHFEIDKKNADLFYYQVKLPLLGVTIGKYFLFGIGFILFLISCRYAYNLSKKNQPQNFNIQESSNSNDVSEQTPLLTTI